jgi:hypothetical protein
MPERIQLRRTKGWRMPANTVVVSRPSAFGNPWTIAAAREAGYSADDAQLRAWCVSLFREWLGDNPRSLTRMLKDGEELKRRLVRRLPELRGKNLACWCPLDQPCHADVLLELANGR